MQYKIVIAPEYNALGIYAIEEALHSRGCSPRHETILSALPISWAGEYYIIHVDENKTYAPHPIDINHGLPGQIVSLQGWIDLQEQRASENPEKTKSVLPAKNFVPTERGPKGDAIRLRMPGGYDFGRALEEIRRRGFLIQSKPFWPDTPASKFLDANFLLYSNGDLDWVRTNPHAKAIPFAEWLEKTPIVVDSHDSLYDPHVQQYVQEELEETFSGPTPDRAIVVASAKEHSDLLYSLMRTNSPCSGYQISEELLECGIFPDPKAYFMRGKCMAIAHGARTIKAFPVSQVQIPLLSASEFVDGENSAVNLRGVQKGDRVWSIAYDRWGEVMVRRPEYGIMVKFTIGDNQDEIINYTSDGRLNNKCVRPDAYFAPISKLDEPYPARPQIFRSGTPVWGWSPKETPRECVYLHYHEGMHYTRAVNQKTVWVWEKVLLRADPAQSIR